MSRHYPSSLCVVMPNWLGDFIMALPALKAVRRDNPEVPLRLWAPRNLAPLGDLISWAGPITPHNGMRSAGAWMSHMEWLRRSGKGTTSLIFVNNFRTALLSKMVGVSARLGLASEGRGWLLTHPVKLTKELRCSHRSQWYGAVSSPLLDSPIDGSCRTLELPQLNASGIPSAFPEDTGNVVALAVGAAYGPAKEYGVEGFRSVVRLLTARGLRPVVVGSASEWEMGAKITADISGAENMAGATSLVGLACLLAKARGFIGNDSGPMHLAAALGVPTVGIFGSTDPAWTGPLGQRVGALSKPPSCAPCFQRTCPLPQARYMQCMKTITPEEVVEALLLIAPQPNLKSSSTH